MKITLKCLIVFLVCLTSCRHGAPRTVVINETEYTDTPVTFFGKVVSHNYIEKLSTWDQFVLDTCEPARQIQWVALVIGALSIAAAIVIGTPIIVKYAKRLGIASSIIWGASVILMLGLHYLCLLIIPLGLVGLIYLLHKTTDWSLVGFWNKIKGAADATKTTNTP